MKFFCLKESILSALVIAGLGTYTLGGCGKDRSKKDNREEKEGENQEKSDAEKTANDIGESAKSLEEKAREEAERITQNAKDAAETLKKEIEKRAQESAAIVKQEIEKGKSSDEAHLLAFFATQKNVEESADEAFKNALGNSEKEVKQLTNAEKVQTKDFENQSAVVSKLEGELELLRKEPKALEAELKEQLESKKIDKSYEKLFEEVSRYNEMVDKLADLQKENTQVVAAQERLTAAEKREKGQVDVFKELIDAKGAVIKDLTTKIQASTEREAIEKLASELGEVKRQKIEFETQLKTKQTDLKRATDELKKVTQKREASETTIEEQKTKIADVKVEMGDELRVVADQISDVSDRLKLETEKREAARVAMETARADLAKGRSKAENLDQLYATYKAYFADEDVASKGDKNVTEGANEKEKREQGENQK